MVHKCNIVLTQFHKLQKMYQYTIKFEIRIPNTVTVRMYFESKVSWFCFFLNCKNKLTTCKRH